MGLFRRLLVYYRTPRWPGTLAGFKKAKMNDLKIFAELFPSPRAIQTDLELRYRFASLDVANAQEATAMDLIKRNAMGLTADVEKWGGRVPTVWELVVKPVPEEDQFPFEPDDSEGQAWYDRMVENEIYEREA